MRKVLFTHSYFYKLDPKQWAFRQPYPPLGTLQAAAVVRDDNFEVCVFDAGLKEGPENIKVMLEREQPSYVVIYDDGFNYLTKMCLTVMRNAAFRMSRLAKQQGCTVILNSSDSSDHYEKYFPQGVDFVIRGEGEDTLRELLRVLEAGDDPGKIAGLAFQKDGQVHTTASRPVKRDLDALPMPAWDLVDLTPYREIWRQHHGYFSLNLATTRGCPYKCNWCAKPIYGNRYNSRSAGHVANEIAHLTRQYGVEHFWMSDDIFGLKPGWVHQFCDALKEKNISIRYKIQSRADLLLEEQAIDDLAASGCETVWMGAESGSQKILDAMDKGITVAQIHEATSRLKLKGIKTGYFLQFGYPGETQEDIDATLDMVLREMPDEIGISVSYPLPGTKFYENVKAQLREKQNWTDSDDLALMFQNTYAPSYYKVLHRYVHSRHRIRRGWNRLRNFPLKPKNFAGDLRKLVSMIYHLPLSWIQGYRLSRLNTGLINTPAPWKH